MSVVVGSRLRQTLSNATLGSSLAGDGLLIRLRSTTIGLLGLVAVVGLGLVAFISQIGWPSVLSGPLPAAAPGGVVHNDTIALVQAKAHPTPAPGAIGVRPQAQANRRDETASNVESGVAGADLLTGPAAEHPASPAPGPSSPPAQAPPAPVPPPAAQPPASTPASGEKANEVETPRPTAAIARGKSRGHGKAKGHGRSDWPGNPASRQDDQRKGSDEQVDEGSSPSLSEDGDDESDHPGPDDRSRGKSNGHRR